LKVRDLGCAAWRAGDRHASQDARLAFQLSASRKHRFVLWKYDDVLLYSFFQMEEVDFTFRNTNIKSLISLKIIFSLI